MAYRPAIFAELGPRFAEAFGNASCVFTIAGVAGAPVRGIVRQERVADLGGEGGQRVEGTRHRLSVPPSFCPGLTSDRDSVSVTADGETTARAFGVGNIEDDGRAMLVVVLDGDI
jgi:hypothetical protein